MADKISIEARISIKNMSAIRFNGTQLEDRVSKKFWYSGYFIRENVWDHEVKEDFEGVIQSIERHIQVMKLSKETNT